MVFRPFAADPEQNTIWDTTIEENVNHTNSTHSSQEQLITSTKIGSTIFSDFSMNLTRGAAAIDKENISYIDKENNPYIAMQELCKVDQKMLVFDLTTNTKQMKVGFDATRLDENAMELTCENEVEMELTGVSDSNNVNEKFTCQIPEMSKVIKTTKVNQTSMESDMEFTCQVPEMSKFVKKIANNQTSTESEMEFTCQVPEMSKVRKTTKVDQTSTESDMEFTCQIPEMSKNNEMSTKPDLEFTCQVPKTSEVMEKAKVNQTSIESDMEFTCQIPEMSKVVKTSKINQCSTELDMEYTCQIPEVLNIAKIIEPSTEFILQVPKIAKEPINFELFDNKIESTKADVEVTCQIPKTNESFCDNSKELTIGMDFTCQIPELSKVVKETDMEFTCQIPKTVIESTSSQIPNIVKESTADCKILDRTDIEVTRQTTTLSKKDTQTCQFPKLLKSVSNEGNPVCQISSDIIKNDNFEENMSFCEFSINEQTETSKSKVCQNQNLTESNDIDKENILPNQTYQVSKNAPNTANQCQISSNQTENNLSKVCQIPDDLRSKFVKNIISESDMIVQNNVGLDQACQLNVTNQKLLESNLSKMCEIPNITFSDNQKSKLSKSIILDNNVIVKDNVEINPHYQQMSKNALKQSLMENNLSQVCQNSNNTFCDNFKSKLSLKNDEIVKSDVELYQSSQQSSKNVICQTPVENMSICQFSDTNQTENNILKECQNPNTTTSQIQTVDNWQNDKAGSNYQIPSKLPNEMTLLDHLDISKNDTVNLSKTDMLNSLKNQTLSDMSLITPVKELKCQKLMTTPSKDVILTPAKSKIPILTTPTNKFTEHSDIKTPGPSFYIKSNLSSEIDITEQLIHCNYSKSNHCLFLTPKSKDNTLEIKGNILDSVCKPDLNISEAEASMFEKNHRLMNINDTYALKNKISIKTDNDDSLGIIPDNYLQGEESLKMEEFSIVEEDVSKKYDLEIKTLPNLVELLEIDRNQRKIIKNYLENFKCQEIKIKPLERTTTVQLTDSDEESCDESVKNVSTIEETVKKYEHR